MTKPVILCILDGWGVQNNGDSDAISKANTPNFDSMIAKYPNSKIETFGLAVGLPKGQMGNSEVGHMNIGGGRVILQNLPKIDKSIESGELSKNINILSQASDLKKNNKSIHIMGLVSDGGVHAHIDHIIYLAKTYAEKGVNVKIHCFMDGRDTSPKSGKGFLERLISQIKAYDNIQIASISGRYFAMDRDKRWERVEKAYNAMVKANSPKFDDPIKAIEDSYSKDVTDEFIEPLSADSYKGFEDEDAILMTNFRADRAREILTAILDESFKEFDKLNISISSALGMVEYSEELNKFLKTIFPAEKIANTLGEVIAENNMKQLRIAETEKYAHVTFFFNGGREDEFKGEDRILVPSPKVATYDLQPEMSASEVTDNIEKVLADEKYDLIIVNYANPDMVGHTGDMKAAMKAVEAVDDAIGRLEKAILAKNGTMFVTADHGNVEQMVDEQGQPHTQHTVGFVPFIQVSKNSSNALKDGSLCDIAPTILDIMNIAKPVEMNGKSLIN